MATRFGSNEVKITIDDTAGAPQNMTNYITEFNGIEIEAMTEEVTAFGDTVVENATVGLSKISDLTIKGFYDSTATTGPDAVFYGTTGAGIGVQRTFKVTYNATSGSSGSWRSHSLETVLVSYKILTSVGSLTKYEAVFRPAEASAFTYTTTGTSS